MKQFAFPFAVSIILFSYTVSAQSPVQVPSAGSFNADFNVKSVNDAKQQKPLKDTDWLRKAKRQRTTGWILLGTGAGLVTTSVIAANHYSGNNGGIEAALSLVLLGAPGVLTSLISIPFFVASGRSRRKAEALEISPGIGWQRTPAPIQLRQYTGYPSVGVKMRF